MSLTRYIGPGMAFTMLIGVAMIAVTVQLFSVDTMLGFAAIIVFAGSAFVYGAIELADRTVSSEALSIALRLRAIGLVLIGLGTLFGALMYFVF